MAECKWYPVCPMKEYLKEGLLDEKYVREYCRGDYRRCVRYQKQARGEPHPDNMLPDGTVDESPPPFKNTGV